MGVFRVGGERGKLPPPTDFQKEIKRKKKKGKRLKKKEQKKIRKVREKSKKAKYTYLHIKT